MQKNYINLIKICVGAETVLDLHKWQEGRLIKSHSGTLCANHLTRMRPKRKEVLNGGSIYWVFKGFILARQQILSLEDKLGADNIRRCLIILNTKIILTETKRKRPFQGWRYLDPCDAPKDLKVFSEKTPQLPASLERGLFEIGVF
ncbi:MAG: lysophospholipase [Rhodobacteraceae bacterium]|nr:lysophospholipase [Paracoccaceae bacterium]